MKNAAILVAVILATATLCLKSVNAFAAENGSPSAATVVPLLTQLLPNIDGKEGVMLTVEYAPGGESAAHRHNANTFVYVLEGSVVMQVLGGKTQTLTNHTGRPDRARSPAALTGW